MNHDFAFGIEVNPCVIEITIGKSLNHRESLNGDIKNNAKTLSRVWLSSNSTKILLKTGLQHGVISS
jgi:hypothetical protein